MARKKKKGGPTKLRLYVRSPDNTAIRYGVAGRSIFVRSTSRDRRLKRCAKSLATLAGHFELTCPMCSETRPIVPIVFFAILPTCRAAVVTLSTRLMISKNGKLISMQREKRGDLHQTLAPRAPCSFGYRPGLRRVRESGGCPHALRRRLERRHRYPWPSVRSKLSRWRADRARISR
jgi:hypothetical protein